MTSESSSSIPIEETIVQWVPLAPLWLVSCSCLVVVLVHTGLNLWALNTRRKREEAKRVRRLARIRARQQLEEFDEFASATSPMPAAQQQSPGVVEGEHHAPQKKVPWYQKVLPASILSSIRGAVTSGGPEGESVGVDTTERTPLCAAGASPPRTDAPLGGGGGGGGGKFPPGQFPPVLAGGSFSGVANSSIPLDPRDEGSYFGVTSSSPMSSIPLPATPTTVHTSPPLLGVAQGGEVGASRIVSNHAVLVAERQDYINAILNGDSSTEDFDGAKSSGGVLGYRARSTDLCLQFGVVKSLLTLTLIFYLLPFKGGWDRYTIFSLCNVAMGQWNFLLLYGISSLVFPPVELGSSAATIGSRKTTDKNGGDGASIANLLVSRLVVPNRWSKIPGVAAVASAFGIIKRIDSWDLLTSLGSILDIEDVRTASLQATAFILVCVAFTPLLITHIVPGVVCYLWIYLPLVLAGLWLRRLYYRRRLVGHLLMLDATAMGDERNVVLGSQNGSRLSTQIKIAFELVAIKTVALIVVVFCLQFSVSQAALLYDIHRTTTSHGVREPKKSIFHARQLPTPAQYLQFLYISTVALRSDPGVHHLPWATQEATTSDSQNMTSTLSPRPPRPAAGKHPENAARSVTTLAQGHHEDEGGTQRKEKYSSHNFSSRQRRQRILAWVGLLGMFLP